MLVEFGKMAIFVRHDVPRLQISKRFPQAFDVADERHEHLKVNVHLLAVNGPPGKSVANPVASDPEHRLNGVDVHVEILSRR
jgi:hypothetical protein